MYKLVIFAVNSPFTVALKTIYRIAGSIGRKLNLVVWLLITVEMKHYCAKPSAHVALACRLSQQHEP